MRPSRNWLLCLAVLPMLLASQAISAQIVVTNITITPPAPTNSNVIQTTIDYTVNGLFCNFSATTVSTVVIGNTVRTTITLVGCEPFFPSFPSQHQSSAQFGPLPAGAYNYEVFFAIGSGPGSFGAQQPFTVVAPATAADIPALQPAALAALMLILVVAGLAVVRQ